MTSRNIVLAAVLAFSAFGCADVGTDDGDDDGDDDGGFLEVCPDLRQVCTGDTVCMGASCEDAFDRDYKVWLNLSGPGPRPCGDDPVCPLRHVEVYYSELEYPILASADPKMAEIRVIPGSSLIAEHRGDQCVIDLTAERLQIGSGTCTAGGVTATLKLNPMPSDGDEAAF